MKINRIYGGALAAVYGDAMIIVSIIYGCKEPTPRPSASRPIATFSSALIANYHVPR